MQVQLKVITRLNGFLWLVVRVYFTPCHPIPTERAKRRNVDPPYLLLGYTPHCDVPDCKLVIMQLNMMRCFFEGDVTRSTLLEEHR